VFHADAAKVDRDVAFVAMVVLVCCKLLFSMFYLFFHTHIVSVYIWMLHMFHTYVASALFGCCVCFTMVFKCFSCVFAIGSHAYFKCYICLQTYVVSVASGCFKNRSDVASPSLLSAALSQCLLLPTPAGHPPPPPPLLDAGDVKVA
jgi:hypothetical protein